MSTETREPGQGSYDTIEVKLLVKKNYPVSSTYPGGRWMIMMVDGGGIL
jgi:hypothetical protein